jgi:hypothetical protein
MSVNPSNYIQAFIISEFGTDSIESYGLGCGGVSSSILTNKEKAFLKNTIFSNLKNTDALLISYQMSGSDASVVYMSMRINNHIIVYIIKREDFIISQRNLYNFLIQLNTEVLQQNEDNFVNFLKNNIFQGRSIDCKKCDQVCAPKYLIYLNEISRLGNSDDFQNLAFDNTNFKDIDF